MDTGGERAQSHNERHSCFAGAPELEASPSPEAAGSCFASPEAAGSSFTSPEASAGAARGGGCDCLAEDSRLILT